MPNPVVSFEVRGPDPEALHRFYMDVFEWDVFVFPGGGYAGVETAAHDHDETTSATTFKGADSHMNDGVVIGSAYGQPAWKYTNEKSWRGFEAGVSGGIAQGEAGVTFYIQVRDLAATLQAVGLAGGETVQPPTEVAPNVNVASFRDPAGNQVGLLLARE